MKTGNIPALKRGDRVVFLSPASPPEKRDVDRCARVIAGWGLNVDYGAHIFDQYGYMAGIDSDRLSDFNSALRDPGVRAIFATRGGKGAYRIADRLDFGAAQSDPKFVVGFSEITILHLSLLKNAGLVGIHGPMVSWSEEYIGPPSIDSLRRAMMTEDDVVLHQDSEEPTTILSTHGKARGPLIGGNLDMISTSAGWSMPSLQGAIWFIEAASMGRGQLDRQLTMLLRSGTLNGVSGVVLGQFVDFSADESWSYLDILRDRLSDLAVPVLGGIGVGHGRNPGTIPIGTMALMDADAGTLTVRSAAKNVV